MSNFTGSKRLHITIVSFRVNYAITYPQIILGYHSENELVTYKSPMTLFLTVRHPSIPQTSIQIFPFSDSSFL